MPYRVKGISTLRYTPEEMTVPRLSHNGQCVEGWVMAPAGQVWQPEGGDLLWLPPSATKSTDVDRAGSIVDVGPLTPDEKMAWVTAELNKHERYLEMIRNKVRSGAVRLTSFLAKMLGLPFDDDGVELSPRVGTGPLAATRTLAYKSAQAEELVAEGRRLAGAALIDRDTGLADPGAYEARVREVSRAAAAKYAATGDYGAAMAELRAGVARTRS